TGGPPPRPRPASLAPPAGRASTPAGGRTGPAWQKKSPPEGGLCGPGIPGHEAPATAWQAKSALAELLAATCLVETDFLALDLAGVTGDQAGLRQHRLERGVVVDQRAGDAVAHRTSLAAFAAAVHDDEEVERLQSARQRS